MKIKSIARTSFIAGFLANMTTCSLIQDYYGQMGMIEQIQTNWIDSAITVPIACTALLLSMYMYIKAHKIEIFFKDYTNKLLNYWNETRGKTNGKCNNKK